VSDTNYEIITIAVDLNGLRRLEPSGQDPH
jgi:hypothetical protein